MHIHIYNPIADKDGQYRLKHLLFLLSIYFCWPIHCFRFFALLCFASLWLFCFACFCFIYRWHDHDYRRYCGHQLVRVAPTAVETASYASASGDALPRPLPEASAGFFSFVSSASPLCKCYANSEQVNNNFHFRHPKQQRTKPGNRSRTWQGY